MNIEPDNILQPLGGNNANARASAVRIMNQQEPTSGQLAELMHKFDLHRLKLRTGIVGLLTSQGELSDGSPFRIVSNSGLHTLMLWPAASVDIEELQPVRIFCIPANTDVQFGWKKPAVEGANGTPASAGNADSGATVTLEIKNGTASTKAKNLNRYQTTLQPATKNIAFFAGGEANNTSAQLWENREWISKDRKTCVTTFDGIRINGVNIGNPGNGTLWACLHSFDPGDGKQTFLVVVRISGRLLEILRSPAKGFSFTTIGSLDLQTIDAAAVSNSSNGFADLTSWIGKIAHNESQTVLSVWVQNPNAETIGADKSNSSSFFVGVVDFNMQTGAFMSATPAQGETITYSSGALDLNASGSFATTGTRQIGFGYDGDVKQFTELNFSGSFTCERTYSGPLTFGAEGDYVYDWTATDTRQVELVNGTITITVALASVTTHTEHREGHIFSSGTYTITVDETSYVSTIKTGKLLYQNGVPAFEIVSTQYDSTDASSSLASLELKAYVGPDIFDLGTNTATLAPAKIIGSKETVSLIGDIRSPSFSGSGSITRWGCAGQQAMGLLSQGGFQAFVTPTTVDRSAFNIRMLDDFVIFSAPKLKAGTPDDSGAYVLDPANYFTHCSDPEILLKINAGGDNSVLKGITFR